MRNIYYHVYCKNILAIKTNVDDFKWVYGSVAPLASQEEYERCILKFEIFVKNENQLGEVDCYEKQFQSYMWNGKNKRLYYRRKFPLNFEIGYNVKIEGNHVFAEIGKHYYSLIKSRIMNLHSAYYLLSDIANMLLLKNNFLTLYSSALYFEPLKKGLVNFAAPNTGKTYTAMQLCEDVSYKLVGEDVVISDGYRIYSCPWTNSYRKQGRFHVDSAGVFSKPGKHIMQDFQDECDITDMIVLSRGQKNIVKDKREVLKDISILNGYLFDYYSSPIIKILAYFDKDYDECWNERAVAFLQKMVDENRTCMIQTEDSSDFKNIIHEMVSEEK